MTEPSKAARDAAAEASEARARIAEKAPRWRQLTEEVRQQNAANHFAEDLTQALTSIAAQTPRRTQP